MFPVSGAEQLNTSGAHTTRPMIREGGIFQIRQLRTFELEGMIDVFRSMPGRHEEIQRPSERAAILSSSTMAGSGQSADAAHCSS